jgi:hypothetical protein
MLARRELSEITVFQELRDYFREADLSGPTRISNSIAIISLSLKCSYRQQCKPNTNLAQTSAATIHVWDSESRVANTSEKT